MGDEGAIICALRFAPSQIRIAQHVARSPERGKQPTEPEVARVHEGQIIVKRWDRERAPRLALGQWKLAGTWGQRLRNLLPRRRSASAPKGSVKP
jgi:hypothetical protein